VFRFLQCRTTAHLDCLGFTRYFERSISCKSVRPVPSAKHFVYLLRSCKARSRYYVGLTSDVEMRLSVHNSGGSVYTADLRPWVLVAAVEFTCEESAVAFERYLKTGSGRAFAKRHFI
jgi:predicted GIY-YIG superfamily endonuclease